MKRIYLSGNPNESQYNIQQQLLLVEQNLIRSNNCVVYNSFDLGFHNQLNSEDIKEWFNLLMSCDTLYLLDGWFYSKHCVSEYNIMQGLGKRIHYQDCNPINDIFNETLRLRKIIHEASGYDFFYYTAKGREIEKVYPRFIFIYYSFHYLNISIQDIAKILRLDRTTIIHALNRFEELYKSDLVFNQINDIVAKKFFI